jgi:transcription-repair coupling factor (superfamily II helicase)
MTKNLLNSLTNYSKEFAENKSYCIYKGFDEAYKLLSLCLKNNLNQDVLIIAKDDNMAKDIYDLAQALNMGNTLLLPSWQVDLYQNINPNKNILNNRIQTLSELYLRKKPYFIIIASFSSVLYKLIPHDSFNNKFLQLSLNQKIKQSDILEFLKNNNYKKVSSVSEDGCFASRGDILDVSSLGQCYRLDFFDDEIERIRLFDSYSQKSIEEIKEAIFYPTGELQLNLDNVNNFKYYYPTKFGNLSYKYLDELENFIQPKGLHNYLPLLYDKTSSIFDYLKNPFLIQIGEDILYNDIHNNYQEKYDYLIKSKDLFKNDTNILQPQDLLIQPEEFNNKNKIILLNNHPHDVEELNNQKEPQIQYQENMAILNSHILIALRQKYNKIEDIFINYLDSINYENLLILYNSEPFKNTIHTIINKHNKQNIFLVNNNSLNNSFSLGKNFILVEEDITGIKKQFKSKNPKKNLLKNLSLFNSGDILVHIKHGFGKYRGLTTLTINNTAHDFLELEYKDNEKLYIPVENIDTLSRYASDEVDINLDKLGSNIFEKKQGKIKEKIKDIAYDLIKLAANRNLKKAYDINIDAQAYENFCKQFPYLPTQDQENAINDVINDFLSGTPSDRLICGDVGFGKTEVALRATFIISNSGYQVLVIAPTTLLCNQHYHNFTKRFQDSALNIKQLSRFVSTKEKAKTKEDLTEGKVDILIATHSALAKDVKFKNIGLIVVDEEQNFGVVHKEKLKTFSEKAHILTLSATPIPRTIQQAFKGIKDLSLISTPPINKLPINTHIVPYELLILKTAIDRELSRGGQIFIVCPKISNINEIRNDLLTIYPNLSYIVAHGQMPTNDLENAMIDFQNKKYDVLLSTSIIESGLDLKNVNTIIIHNSDLFGLAQLYQIRGRVGRGDLQAYAYLLYDDKKHISALAQKRLGILQNLDYLGASFALASYDLELRGAGNLLGEEQSGHIKEIGYDLYQKLLEQEIYNLKNQNNEDVEYNNFAPLVNTNVPVLIPKQYINDVELAIEMYQTLGKINKLEEINEAKEQMQDRFGKIPQQVLNLFDTIELKILSKKSYVEKITFGNKGILIEFYDGKFPKVQELLHYINEQKGEITIKPQGALVVNQINPTYDIQFKKTKSLLLVLQDILKKKIDVIT